MDKYQLNLINRGTITFKSEKGEEKVEAGEKLIVYQNENYKIGGYKIVFSNPSIEAITYLSKKHISKDNVIVVDYSYDKAELELVISFKNGLADDCSMTISPVLADKGAFDAKIERQNQAELLSGTALMAVAGSALLNVFWKKTNSSIDKCIIKVFFRGENGIDYIVLNIEIDGKFLSVSGLAYGRYSVSLEEYSGNKLVVSAEANATFALFNCIEESRKEMKEIKEILKGVGRAAGGHWVTN